MPMPNNQVVILEDAISTCENFWNTYRLTSPVTREMEQRELIERIKGDIETVLKMGGYQ